MELHRTGRINQDERVSPSIRRGTADARQRIGRRNQRIDVRPDSCFKEELTIDPDNPESCTTDLTDVIRF